LLSGSRRGVGVPEGPRLRGAGGVPVRDRGERHQRGGPDPEAAVRCAHQPDTHMARRRRHAGEPSLARLSLRPLRLSLARDSHLGVIEGKLLWVCFSLGTRFLIS